jgi:hypothetical protein
MSNCCYFSGAGNGSHCFELYDKARIQSDINLYSCAATEAINLYGQKVHYYVNTMSLLSADSIYGEQPTSVFEGPTLIKMLIQLNESALSMSRFGLNADDDLTAYITYDTFETAFSGNSVFASLSQSVEPKSGDVIALIEYGNDRVNGRGSKFFEITRRMDQNVGENINPLGGHYGWQLNAKRLDYSWQPGLPNEPVNQQVNDDTFYGKLSSNIEGEEVSEPKSYPGSADIEAKKILDTTPIDTSVYGSYDLN